MWGNDMELGRLVWWADRVGGGVSRESTILHKRQSINVIEMLFEKHTTTRFLYVHFLQYSNSGSA